jgi:hypothetical protein
VSPATPMVSPELPEEIDAERETVIFKLPKVLA